MRVAVFSDVHGNIEALTSVLQDIKKENIDEVICLGDTIGIGPYPKECLDIIIENNIQYILGNHELYCLKGTEIDDKISENEAVHHKWQGRQVTEAQKEFLNKCPLTLEKEYNGKKVLFEHFLVDYDSKDEYPFYDVKIIKDGSIEKIVEALDYDLIFIGHEHKAFSIETNYMM